MRDSNRYDESTTNGRSDGIANGEKGKANDKQPDARRPTLDTFQSRHRTLSLSLTRSYSIDACTLYAVLVADGSAAEYSNK